jgi:hypothetical protein
MIKMTNKELKKWNAEAEDRIIKALECCCEDDYECQKFDVDVYDNESCDKCPLNKTYDCTVILIKQALNLINRQEEMLEAAINGQETLQKYVAEKDEEIERLKAVNDSFADIGKLYSEIKAEAYKEFADRLCEDRVSNDPVVIAVKVELKELVGEDK